MFKRYRKQNTLCDTKQTYKQTTVIIPFYNLRQLLYHYVLQVHVNTIISMLNFHYLLGEHG